MSKRTRVLLGAAAVIVGAIAVFGIYRSTLADGPPKHIELNCNSLPPGSCPGTPPACAPCPSSVTYQDHTCTLEGCGSNTCLYSCN